MLGRTDRLVGQECRPSRSQITYCGPATGSCSGRAGGRATVAPARPDRLRHPNSQERGISRRNRRDLHAEVDQGVTPHKHRHADRDASLSARVRGRDPCPLRPGSGPRGGRAHRPEALIDQPLLARAQFRHRRVDVGEDEALPVGVALDLGSGQPCSSWSRPCSCSQKILSLGGQEGFAGANTTSATQIPLSTPLACASHHGGAFVPPPLRSIPRLYDSLASIA